MAEKDKDAPPSNILGWVQQKVQVYKDKEENRPKPRSCHTMTVIGTNCFLFGGLTDGLVKDVEDPADVDSEFSSAQPSNEVFKLDLTSKNNMEWKELEIKGDKPMPRWRHTMTVFENTQILLFGGFNTTEHRLNDVWVLDTISFTWMQPNAKHNLEVTSSNCQLSNNEWSNVPPPRAGHSATAIGDVVYIFGGYGGLGYSRRDLDDLFALNVFDWTWTKVNPKGAPPEKRSGHQACAIENKVFIMGGSSSSHQFEDVHILDTELDPPVWSKMTSAPLPYPSWNHCACSVIAIPTWKIFTFGGLSGTLSDHDRQGKTINVTSILDTGVSRWTYPKVEGRLPSSRSDACMAYDAKNSRLLVFGGWADEWLDDMYTLDVGNIVGPPYAITDITPRTGPVTGNTEVTITGIDFMNTPNVVVRFGNHRQSVDVNGIFKSQSKITCITPNNSKLSSGEVDVRISLNGDSFTTTSQKFNYFTVTTGANCIIYGPGVMSGCALKEEVSFLIQARDDAGVNRTSGGDEFQVVIKHIGGGEDGDDVRLTGVLVEDLQNGKYLVTYAARFEGKYKINVEFNGTFGGKAGPLRGSGSEVDFNAKAPRENNQMSGDLVIDSLRKDIVYLQEFVDNISKSLLSRMKDDSWNSDQQIAMLIKVKEALQTVELRGTEISLIVDRSECILNFLLEENIVISGLEEALMQSKFTWDKVLRESPQIANKIAPMMRSHMSKIKNDIAAYEAHLAAYLSEVMKSDFYFYKTGVDKSLELLNAADSLFKDEQQAFAKHMQVATVFECGNDMSGCKAHMNDMKSVMSDFRTLWTANDNALKIIAQCREYLWEGLDSDDLEESAKQLVLNMRKLPKHLKGHDAFSGMDRILKDFNTACPIITSLQSKAMRDRHWKELQEAVGQEFVLPGNNPDATLGLLLDLNLHKLVTEIDEITEKAGKEAKHEETLKALETTWSTVQFVMSFYKDTDIPLVRLEDEIVEQLESDQMAVQSIVGGRYPFFKGQAGSWQQTLSNIAEVSQALQDIQRTWSYLEPLFIGSDEVRRELPEDAKSFEEVDMEVKQILLRAWKMRNAKNACNVSGLLSKLEGIGVKQDKCKKSLTDFLDGKRRQFPRFYFMSEADLLDLLSNSSQPHKVLTQVDKILLATKELEVIETGGEERPTAVAFVAGVGKEKVKFTPVVKLVGKAEQYLEQCLKSQVYTLSTCLASSMKRYPNAVRSEWVVAKDAETGDSLDPAQIILLVAAIDYVTFVETAMKQCQSNGEARPMEKASNILKNQLADLITMTQANLSKGDRQRVMAMITLDAHSRDIMDVLLKENALSPTDFQWQSKLRPAFKQDVGKNAEVASMARFHICDAVFDYGFEYLGNGPRLVITPLTDRIYVTATQALHLKMGCAPAGPAGTGKTESTKDLASALGKCCYVFNCSPEMDYQSMGNIFKGLAASGSWGCFDEFNRLIPEVLSVCSVQFKAVCDGLRVYDKKDKDTHKVTIEGDTVHLDPTCGAFITMNPGYLGRSELPEGLKALFRPITVIVPDLVLICENMMMAEGFLNAKLLASKFYGLYSLLSELLSKQSHYDWGLRAVKSVLVVAGQLKRAEPDLPEDALLMRALRDFNIPKIVQADEVVFFGLLGDLFPNLNPSRVFDEELNECIKVACENTGLWADPFFTLKCMQLDELLDIRHCVFIMGPPGAGKSTTWKVLQAARNIKTPDNKVKTVDINPKTMPTEDLYGHISMATREWKDGLLSAIMRDLGRIPNENPKWLILDGDLDANWIESMNSVMDDNKMLTLASNERIPLKSYMRMIFEIRDLKYATPATVSRAGILYISTDGGSQWRAVIGSWTRSRSIQLMDDPDREFIHTLFEKYLPTCLKYFASDLQGVVQYNDISLAVGLLRLLDTILTRAIVQDPVVFETAFVFCLIWGLGSILTIADDGTDYRKMFSEFFKTKFKTVKIPNRETIFDYYLDPTTNKFESWKVCPVFKEVEFDSTVLNMSDLTVPTAESASVSYWLEKLVYGGFNVMLAGPAGTGKTQLLNGLLAGLNAEQHIHTTVNMNFYTSASVLLTSMEAPLSKRTGSVFGPPGSAKLVYFIDDLNLPELDKYNTQSGIALLRQHIDYNHWYDQQKLAVKTVDDCQYISALNPTAGSFNVNPRLQRHFSTFAVGMPSATSLLTIYQTFLDGHLQSQGFNMQVQALSSNLIKGALAVHKEVSETFRKTAMNFHYEFNIRHLANVFAGLLVATPFTFQEPEKFVFLWLHESERVYGDRLVDYEDLARFKIIMETQGKKAFGQYNISKFYLSGGGVAPDPLVFCHFADPSVQPGDELVFDQSGNVTELRTTLESALNLYNEVNVVMNLVLFDDAVLHVARIVRIVRQTGGHAMLVGVGGSGKQSLSRLAAYICGFSVHQIMVNQHYGLMDFKTDLQTMYNKAGVKLEGVMFLLTDTQITNEKFLVYLNDLLSSGNIPDLYSKDEKESIVNSLTNKAKGAGYTAEPASVWQYFISKVRENLHCCLCMSPVGVNLRVRARRFPALANCTVIDWFQPWPVQALSSVGKKVLDEMDVGTEEVRLAVEAYMPAAFTAVNKMCKEFADAESKYVYTTPKSYLEMLNLYKSMLASKRTKNDRASFRLTTGIEKLRKAAADVIDLEANLRIMLEAAEEKRVVSEGIATTVAAEKSIVEDENTKAVIEERKVETIQSEVSKQFESAQKDLEAAEPALLRALNALDSLDKKDLGQCKTMTKPPPGVDDIFIAVMILMAGINPNIPVQKTGKIRDKERTWEIAKKALLGNVNAFLDELKAFKQNIDERTVADINFKEVLPFLEMPHFLPDVIETKNKAAAGLCSWVINIVAYNDIVVTVEPKKQKLKEATQQLAAANERLEVVQLRVKTLQEKLDVLTTEYNAAEEQRREAQDTADRGKLKLELANRLTSALGSENIRWGAGIESLKVDRELLVGDCLLASSFISYIGPFTKKYRGKLVEDTLIPLLTAPTVKGSLPIPLTEDMEPVSLMCSDAEIAEYQTQGLPADMMSAENGAIVLNSARYPLLVDPQLQAIYWIKKRLGSKLDIGRIGQKDLIMRVLKAVETGQSFLIENMGEFIDPSLYPIISRTTVKRAGRKFIQIGDQEVEINPAFRLYLHTKLSNPHYPPEIQAETTLVNFSVTQDGLDEQLLALVVKNERPDLAAQRQALIMQQNLFTIKIQELEDLILMRLAESQGDITENRELIEELELSKKISDEINIKIETSKVTSEKIDATSELYRPVSRRGALLFFVMNGLYKVHTYYMFSLNSFIYFFLLGIARASGRTTVDDSHDDDDGKAINLDELEAQIARRITEIEERDKQDDGSQLPDRLKDLKQSITLVVFDFIRTGLFEKDKLTVVTMITFSIMVDEGLLRKEYVDIITRGRVAEDVAPLGQELSQWLSESAWAKLKAVEEDMGALDLLYADLTEKVAADAEDWEEWYNNKDPENFGFPGDFAGIDEMSRLIIMRVLRPDRMPFALTAYVKDKLGEEFVYQSPFDMAVTYEFTTAQTPCLFVLYPGVDPTSWVEDLGKSMDVSTEKGNFANISMGQGQEKRADDTIKHMADIGGWVFLQNVHLMQTWLPTLDEKLETLTCHRDFRVFISAEPPPLSYMKNVPEGLLQSCIVVANEPPSDLKANLSRAWTTFSQERISVSSKPDAFKACLFGLSFFHSVMLGRRRFGSQGWSRAYGFNMGDLKICADVLESYLDRKTADIPWQDLRYIFGEIMYGGHITDFFDRRTNNTYLSVLFNDSLLKKGQLAPRLSSPDPKQWDYEEYSKMINNSLPPESPIIYGLHPNAEIGFLTNKADNLFHTILRLSIGMDMSGPPQKAGGEEDTNDGNSVAVKEEEASAAPVSILRETLDDLMKRCPNQFNMILLSDASAEKLLEESGPYIVVLIQECTRINALIQEMSYTLDELQKGLNGQLNMSQAMEDMAECLDINQVPGRNPFHACSWERLAWPSKKSLSSWFADLLLRRQQLYDWSNTLTLPFSIWLPGLINPTALLTAIKQVTARKNSLPLDCMSLDTFVTKMYKVSDALMLGSYPEDGIFVHGLMMEGARWTDEEESQDDVYTVAVTQCAGHITESRLKVLLTNMPVMYVKAVPVQPEWSPESVGYLRKDPTLYECPVYITSMRGPTFVFLATLKSVDLTHVWILAGVALLMQSDD